MINELPFQGLPLEIFVFVYQGNHNETVSAIKNKFASQSGTLNQTLQLLLDEGYLSIDATNKKYERTDAGKYFYIEYNKIGIEYVHQKPFDLAIMFFLSKLKTGIPYEFFPKLILEKAIVESPSLSNSASLHDYMHHNSKLQYCYSQAGLLNENGKSYFEGYQKKKEQTSKLESLRLEELEGNVKEIKLKLKDYDTDKNRERKSYKLSVAAVIISGIAVVITILAIIFKR